MEREGDDGQGWLQHGLARPLSCPVVVVGGWRGVLLVDRGLENQGFQVIFQAQEAKELACPQSQSCMFRGRHRLRMCGRAGVCSYYFHVIDCMHPSRDPFLTSDLACVVAMSRGIIGRLHV